MWIFFLRSSLKITIKNSIHFTLYSHGLYTMHCHHNASKKINFTQENTFISYHFWDVVNCLQLISLLTTKEDKVGCPTCVLLKLENYCHLYKMWKLKAKASCNSFNIHSVFYLPIISPSFLLPGSISKRRSFCWELTHINNQCRFLVEE